MCRNEVVDGNLSGYAHVLAGVANWTTTYAHDRAGRLTGEVRTNGPSPYYSRGYEYDPNGNRTAMIWEGTPYPYGAAGPNDEFTSGFGRAMADYDGDGDPRTFDDNGLLRYLQYDEGGRVTAVSGSGASTYRYDGDGRRVERADASGTTRFVYDGDQPVLETNGSNQTTLYRTPGAGWVRNGAQRFDYETALGSTVETRDQSGAVVGRTEYDAFGVESYVGATTDRGSYRFAGAKGYVSDDATGFEMLGARYYLPWLGRFLTQDPIGHEGGLNLYAYCGNSPLLNVDPDGLEIRALNSREKAAFGVATEFLREYGNVRDQLTAFSFRFEMQTHPSTFMIDTEYAGNAVWRRNVLYLNPNLFTQRDTFSNAKLQRASDAAYFAQKAWFASILAHESDHLAHNESYQILPPFQNMAERRAWDVQIGFLRRVRANPRVGSTRRMNLDSQIDRALGVRKEY